MKRLFLLVIASMFLSGCSKAYLATPGYAINTENGNKIYAYQDIDPNGEHTTIIVARVEGADPEAKLAAIMKHIKDIFNSKENLDGSK